MLKGLLKKYSKIKIKKKLLYDLFFILNYKIDFHFFILIFITN